ncbi:unnamed protein product [Dibothriocephalus latus]|uniref:Uncharacterized protein n=1 Tax=Dibothriocephalus latus TaxID=60516 RepID=A0A3P7LNM5_DIBLA|nr:unnamed protein product [Dibothriocephalus latus]
MGIKYNLTDSKYLDFLANLESIISAKTLTEDEQFTIRDNTVHALKNRTLYSVVSKEEKKALKSLKTDKSIIILPADKGGSTAILNKADYDTKMLSLLEDRSTYKPLNTDPTKKQNAAIEKVLKRLTETKQISVDVAKFLKQTEPNTAKIYGQPKVHKPEVPLRPIVSLIGAPNYKIS